MDARFAIVATTEHSDRLIERVLQADDVGAVLRAIASGSDTAATRFEVSTKHDEILVRMMRRDGLVQVTLWPAEHRCCYLCSAEPDPDTSEFIDIGWESFPAWCVTEDVHAAMSAIGSFLETRALDPERKWHCQDLG